MRQWTILTTVVSLGTLIACSESPITSHGPAAKALSDPPSFAVEWSCDADSLNTLWSVFNGQFTFHINGNQVDIRERTQEDVNVHSIHDATVDYNEGRCTLHSGFVSADSVTRIWQGLVWRDAIHRYYLQDDEDIYQINRRYQDAEGEYTPPFEIVWYRDFTDRRNRDEPRPAGAYELRTIKGVHTYYLPVNFSQAALDTLRSIPQDDRPYLENPLLRIVIEPPEPKKTRTRGPTQRGPRPRTPPARTPDPPVEDPPVPELDPTPEPEPAPDPVDPPEPEPEPEPTPDPIDPPEPEPEPEPTPDPEPEPEPEPDKSSDATLSSLSISNVGISFDSNVFSYSLEVPYSRGSISIDAAANHPNASVDIKLNGAQISSQGRLNVGANQLVVEVTAEDGSVKTYNIEIRRRNSPPPVVSVPPPPPPKKSSDATLKSLTISVGEITFDPNVSSYSLEVVHSVNSVSVSAETNHPSATFVVLLNGTEISGAGSLDVGANSLVIEVTAEDGSTGSYTVEIERASPPHVVEKRILARTKSCCVDNGGGVISRFPSSVVYITEIKYSDDSCVRSECGDTSYPCSGSATSSVESCQAGLTRSPSAPGGGSCSHQYIPYFVCDSPCPIGYTCD